MGLVGDSEVAVTSAVERNAKSSREAVQLSRESKRSIPSLDCERNESEKELKG